MTECRTEHDNRSSRTPMLGVRRTNRKFSNTILAAATIAAALVSSPATAQTLTTLVTLNGSNGSGPNASLIADANGNLFGTATSGGAYGCGTVFEVPKIAGVYSTAIALVSFDCVTAANPAASLVADANGNLFGTTSAGGNTAYDNQYGNGTVFEIPYNNGVYASTPTILVNFNGANGAAPSCSLILDSNGNLFGTTPQGGLNLVADESQGYGTVFEILKTATGYANTPTVLVYFNYDDGAIPNSGLVFDSYGNLFGTTTNGGVVTGSGFCCEGTVFEIPKTATGYASTPTLLAIFDGDPLGSPLSNLIFDSNGNLFGTTAGGATGGGAVFEIAKTATGYANTVTVLYFGSPFGPGGAGPVGTLIADANGSLFGTTVYGGTGGSCVVGGYAFGTAYEIPKVAGGYASTPTVLVNFTSTGFWPYGGLIADSAGNLFGTTSNSACSRSGGSGTVFEISNSGFVPPVYFAGTVGAANCSGVSISTLAHTYGGLAAAARALGYASVAALQSAIAAYCGS